VDPTIPEELEAIVLKAMHRDPDRRYQTATELHRDLVAHARDAEGVMLPDELADFTKTLTPMQKDLLLDGTAGSLPIHRRALPFMLVGLCGLASGVLTAHHLLF
jgi:serine/threonine protein kinase